MRLGKFLVPRIAQLSLLTALGGFLITPLAASATPQVLIDGFTLELVVDSQAVNFLNPRSVTGFHGDNILVSYMGQTAPGQGNIADGGVYSYNVTSGTATQLTSAINASSAYAQGDSIYYTDYGSIHRSGDGDGSVNIYDSNTGTTQTLGGAYTTPESLDGNSTGLIWTDRSGVDGDDLRAGTALFGAVGDTVGQIYKADNNDSTFINFTDVALDNNGDIFITENSTGIAGVYEFDSNNPSGSTQLFSNTNLISPEVISFGNANNIGEGFFISDQVSASGHNGAAFDPLNWNFNAYFGTAGGDLIPFLTGTGIHDISVINGLVYFAAEGDIWRLTQSAQVPEPATALLLGSALLGLSRKRKKLA